MKGPLEGIRILDLTSVVMGPYCTLQLADMGADVIKIENETGDTTRYIGPSRSKGMGSLFLHLNRNKRSIVLNLKTDEGKKKIDELIKSSDIFIHSMRPQSIERLKLTYEDLIKMNKEIIYCGMYGFSKNGPYGDKPAYDDIIQGAAGVAATQGQMTGSPQYLSSLMADKTAGLIGVNAIVAALYHRERTGRGQEIEVPMFETIVSYNMIEHMYGETFTPSLGSSYYGRAISPYRKPYETKDGYIGVLIYNDKHWDSFFECSGHKELRHDVRFSTINTRSKNIDFVYQTIENIMRERTTDEWLEIFEKADIPCTKINQPEDLFENPHLQTTNFFQTVHHPSEGWIRTMKFPVNFSLTPATIREFAPLLGEHNTEVFNKVEKIKLDRTN